MAQCPYCKAPVLAVTIEDVSVNASTGQQWRGISYCCMACRSVLSVGIDPVALKTDTVNEVLRALGKGQPE